MALLFNRQPQLTPDHTTPHHTTTMQTTIIARLPEATPAAAACGCCGGWTSSGGMSQHHSTRTPVMGRYGCTCFRPAYATFVACETDQPLPEETDAICDLGVHTTESALALLKQLRHYKVLCHKTGKLTNRRERTFFAHASVQLPIEGSPGRVFPGMTSIEVSYTAAVKYVTDLLRFGLEERGARIRIQASKGCIFIG